ncbi:hypothetical protein ANN_08975 [Periplaneta americana]|uniref:HAT C-terminal dimerisation domain-containing protein n=1 Tax=Periplaneta americana TaxID=6978 RepID=A0ABQ8T3W3_PERAM|nr:hypothetical protein ANN_08975 [Periplaneta americana]
MIQEGTLTVRTRKIRVCSELYKDLKEHLSKSTAFKVISKTIQNELLDCMLKVYHEEVTKELNSVNYVSIIADDTTDISCQFQLVLLLRYIVDVERFWKFLNPESHDGLAISKCILTELDPLIGNDPNKLIAQIYDGASVMSGGLNGVQKLVKDKYQNANYIHCYAHQINLIVSKAASINRQAHRDKIDEIISGIESETENRDNATSQKGRRVDLSSDDKRRQAVEICEAIIVDIKFRFQFTKLFEVEQFENYERQFPDNYLSETVKMCPFLEANRLKSELQVCYARPELKSFWGSTTFELNFGQHHVFPEMSKLLKMLITMPMSTSEAERCFSMLKRIKTFLRNTMKEERLTALGMLSCEKSFVWKIGR